MEPHFGEAIQVIVDNYNAHKLDKNKELIPEDVIVLSWKFTEKGVWHLFLTTKRNDGLLYELLADVETEKTTLYLYNRIARRVITKEQNA